MAESNLKEQLIKRYGAKEGMRIYLAIVPGIRADFKKVLKEKAEQNRISVSNITNELDKFEI